MRIRIAVFALLLACAAVSRGEDSPRLVSGIQAFHWHGQTFLQWEEKEAASWTTFNVYRSDAPIMNVTDQQVECLARDIIPRSGRNFYELRKQDYMRDVPAVKERREKSWPGNAVWGLRPRKIGPVPGFQLPGDHGLSSPTGGLFVHTVARTGKSYYAVTYTPFEKEECATVAQGQNATPAPVAETQETPEPYQICGPKEPFPDDGKKKQGVLALYALMGMQDKSVWENCSGIMKTYLFWMPKEFGWREGLPTQATVRYMEYEDYNGFVQRDYYEFWPDDSNFAFMGFPNSWWYGYNTEIVHPEKMKDGVVKDYSHRKLLYLVQWFFKTHPQVDRNTFSIRGMSMGGTGAMCFGLRHPELFAYIDATVPGADLAKLPGAKVCLEDTWGSLDCPIKAETGRTIWDEVSNTRYVSETKTDLPFIRMSHGRIDSWMIWTNTLTLYQALIKNRHGFVACWTPAGHGALRFCTAHFLNYPLQKIALDKSFLVLTDCSNDEHFGNGDIRDGDPYGGLNLYIDWEVESDAPETYAVKMRSNKGDSGATITVTPRRLQQFKVKAGDRVAYQLKDDGNRLVKEGAVTADENGLLTVRNLGPIYGSWSHLVLKHQKDEKP